MSTHKDLSRSDETQIIDFIVHPETKSIDNLEAEKQSYNEIAKNQTWSLKRVNLRLLESDITRIKGKAVKEGLPYQTLIKSVVHKYATGQLVDKK